MKEILIRVVLLQNTCKHDPEDSLIKRLRPAFLRAPCKEIAFFRSWFKYKLLQTFLFFARSHSNCMSLDTKLNLVDSNLAGFYSQLAKVSSVVSSLVHLTSTAIFKTFKTVSWYSVTEFLFEKFRVEINARCLNNLVQKKLV